MVFGVAKHSFKMILISSSGQDSPDRGSPGLSGRSGWFFLCPATCPDPHSSVWAVSSLGRGIPESQGIPNPGESGAFHPTPPVAGPARVSSFQAAALRPPAGPVPPFQGLPSLGFPRKTMPHSCWNKRSISKGPSGEFKMHFTVIITWQNSEFQPILVLFL